jgi:hypothetical protein
MFQPSPLAAEVYRPPSDEALCLVRHAPWLTSPEQGQAAPAARLWLQLLIAPMTQLTLVSFDLQAFLFLVFHRSRVAVMFMLRLGYAPERYAELQGWAERAWATGQPALDFVGTGGGTFLAPPSASPDRASAP